MIISNQGEISLRRTMAGAVLLALVILTMGCDQQPKVSSSSTGLMPPKGTDAASVAAGEKIYTENCERCHGKTAQGDPQWRKVGPDGQYPPPPLNGTGHAWHHSNVVLHDIIKNGSPPGQGNMPAWREKLSDAQIDEVISYFQSLWSDEVYAAWYAMQQTNP